MTRPPVSGSIALLALIAARVRRHRRCGWPSCRCGDNRRARGARAASSAFGRSSCPAARGQILDRRGHAARHHARGPRHLRRPPLRHGPRGRGRSDRRVLGAARPGASVPRSRGATGRSPTSTRQVDLDCRERSSRASACPASGSSRCRSATTRPGRSPRRCWGSWASTGTGLAGWRAHYDDALAGTPGERTVEMSARRASRSSSGHRRRDVEPVPGVDDCIPRSTARCSSWRRRRCERGRGGERGQGRHGRRDGPGTGDVYAMANYPWFDPNDYEPSAPIRGRLRNRAVTDAFEPGSVNKIITAAAALETGAVSLDAAVPGARLRCRSDEFTIHDSHEHPVESMTIGDIIAESSNIGDRADRRAGGKRDARARSWTGSDSADRPGSGSRAKRRACCRPADELGRRRRARRSRSVQGVCCDPAADGHRLRHDRERRALGRSRARARHRGRRRRVRRRPTRADRTG